MKYDPQKHHRRSIRLPHYDYTSPGYYFVTICTQNRACLFGIVENEQMVLNDAGKMIEKWIEQLASKFPDIQCDSFIIMPNHVHLNIQIVGTDPCVCPKEKGEHIGSPQRGSPQRGSPIPRVVQWFKTMTTNEYIRGVKQNRFPEFPGKFWQRNYYEHLIRNDDELNQIRNYIINNPLKWGMDKNHPDNIKT